MMSVKAIDYRKCDEGRREPLSRRQRDRAGWMKRVLRWLGLMPGFPSAEMALLLFVFAEGSCSRRSSRSGW